MALSLALVWGAAPSSFLLSSAAAAPGASHVLGMEALHRLDQLPRFKPSVKVGSISSYDRTGGNDDGFSGKYSFVRKEPEGLVIAELNGPGMIHRLWTPTPSDDVMEFFFDGEAQPRIEVKFRDLFLGQHLCFPRPLVGGGAGGFYCYVPLPFAKACKVRVRGERVQFYQINYSLYPSESPIQSFSPNFDQDYLAAREKACRVFAAAGTDISTYVAPPSASVKTDRVNLTLQPRASAVVFASQKPGRIVGLRSSPGAALTGKDRDLVLRIAFDGEAPSVLCPLGDFFGYAWGQPAMQSLLVGATASGAYAYFPMPYHRSAKIELVSERSSPVSLVVEVLHTSAPRTAQEGQFCAVWRRENPTTNGVPFTFADLQGRGHVIGCTLQAQGLESGKTLFFEGDDQTTIDGELVVHGTGSEDFFNGGWYDVPDRWEKQLSFPLSGCLGYAKHLGRTGGYRLLLGDAYVFGRSIKQTIEHSGEKNNIPTDYCGVTYFYAERTPPACQELAAAGARRVTDPREVIFPAWWQTPIHSFTFDRAALTRRVEKLGNEEVRFLSLTAGGQDWFGPPFLCFTCEMPKTARYEVFVDAIKGPGQAMVQLFQNEVPQAPPVDFYAEARAKSARVSLGKLELVEGKNNVMLKLPAKHGQASGFALDLVQLVFVSE